MGVWGLRHVPAWKSWQFNVREYELGELRESAWSWGAPTTSHPPVLFCMIRTAHSLAHPAHPCSGCRHSLAGGHLTERGYNALEASWAASLFLRNVTFLNTDNGIKFTRVDHSTLSGITFGVTAPRWLPGDKNELNGHHAVSITEGHGNLLTRWGGGLWLAEWCMVGGLCGWNEWRFGTLALQGRAHAGVHLSAFSSRCGTWVAWCQGRGALLPSHHRCSTALVLSPTPCPSHPCRFNVTAPFFHDISLSGGAMLNVISDGGGADLNLDLHRAGACVWWGERGAGMTPAGCLGRLTGPPVPQGQLHRRRGADVCFGWAPEHLCTPILPPFG